MGRAPCCSKVGLHRGPWSPKEDDLLINFIQAHGEGKWRSLPQKAGLLRCGKSCRLRWMNYLRPDIKRGNISPDEDDLIIRLHSLLGNRWSLIAGRLPGRTDNEIKNYWNTHLIKRLRSQGSDKDTNDDNVKAKSKFNLPGRKSGLEKSRIRRGSNWNDNMMKEKEENNGERGKTKIHLPKAIRVTSLRLTGNNDNNNNTGFESNTTTTATISSGNGSAACTLSDRDVPWHDGDHDHGVESLIGCDFSTSDKHLGKLYEEFLQLIKVENQDHDDQDQFNLCAESLLF
ncbi:hypothetical protein Nepgr_002233 [Nepenthes gracilis]|uniref:Uncharacterized protein n=1 Tax=Nepenthes gracilis TaxID=150966 RepID=A0AAD3RXM4_NEPGR|nr:hypothetical protein Nepgr_002233 [Nepenthes gracilis]